MHGVLFRGRYLVNTLVSRSAIYFTYLATDQDTAQNVELKVLVHPDPHAAALLVAEASAIQRVAVPGTQRVREVIHDERCIIVLDAPGDRPSQELAPLDDTALRSIAHQAAAILEDLHGRAILHRALRPDHLRLDEAMNVTFAGWGWEHWLGAVLGLGLSSNAREYGHYVAPEAVGEKGTASGDLYSLGVTLMHLATAQEPQELYDFEQKAYVWREAAGLDAELADLIDELLRERPGDRPSSAKVLVQKLQALLPEPQPAEGEAPPTLAAEGSAAVAQGSLTRRPGERSPRWPYWVIVVTLFFPAWSLSEAPMPPRRSHLRVSALYPSQRPQAEPVGLTWREAPVAHMRAPAPPLDPRPVLGLRRRVPPVGPKVPASCAPSPRRQEVPGGLVPALRRMVARAPREGPRPSPVASGDVEIRVSRLFHSLELYQGSLLMQRFSVALGASGSTPVGSFPVVSKAVDPTYRARDGHLVPGGHPSNPLGDRWIGLEVAGRSGIGIHGTNDPDSIGGDYSQGCIRMRNEDVELLYRAIGLGARIVIEP